MPDHLGERLDIGTKAFVLILAYTPFPHKDNPFEGRQDRHARTGNFLTQ
jgi:hypothetical protein